MNNTQHLTDEEILKRSLTERDFFGYIIERYEHKLRIYIERKSNASDSDIDDLLQNVFIKVYKNIKDFDPSLRFSSWIYRICYHEMIDWYRKEKRTPHTSFDADEKIFNSLMSDDSTDHIVMTEERKKAVIEALTSLNQKYKDIVELRFYEEKSYEEISDILQIPPGTVATQLNRVKKILKEKLQHHA
ncbi:MAG: RNA polymerase sigma factor [Minisyncoccota bacterium]